MKLKCSEQLSELTQHLLVHLHRGIEANLFLILKLIWTWYPELDPKWNQDLEKRHYVLMGSGEILKENLHVTKSSLLHCTKFSFAGFCFTWSLVYCGILSTGTNCLVKNEHHCLGENNVTITRWRVILGDMFY